MNSGAGSSAPSRSRAADADRRRRRRRGGLPADDQPRLRRGIDLSRPDQARRRSDAARRSLILGAGLAGMTAAYELRRAGYKVQVLEYNARAGGRNWTVRGGDVYVELGGARQDCQLRRRPIPQSRAVAHSAPPLRPAGLLPPLRRRARAVRAAQSQRLFPRDPTAFGGAPQRIREIKADFSGGVAELLAKATRKGALDDAVTKEDREILLEALRELGGLDATTAIAPGRSPPSFAATQRPPGGGLSARPEDSEPIGLDDILTSRLWAALRSFLTYDFQTTMFQPVGGMGRIGEAFGARTRRCHPLQRQSRRDRAGRARRRGAVRGRGRRAGERARRLVRLHAAAQSSSAACRSQVGAPMREAICALPYAPAVKVGLQFSRRFWEEDEHIYGGISYTDQPIRQIAYPNHGFNAGGKGVLLGAYLFGGANAYEFTAMSAGGARAESRVEQGAAGASAISRDVRDRLLRRLGALAVHARLRGRLDRRRCARSIMTISARSTAASRSPASTPPTSPPGRRARSCRRSIACSACTRG